MSRSLRHLWMCCDVIWLEECWGNFPEGDEFYFSWLYWNIYANIYIDDIIIKFASENGHLDHLRQSFERMRKYIPKINSFKCVFCVHARDFLSFMVYKKSIEINQNKTKTIMETRPPSTKKELQYLLGKIIFLRRFISNPSGKIRALLLLLRLKRKSSDGSQSIKGFSTK